MVDESKIISSIFFDSFLEKSWLIQMLSLTVFGGLILFGRNQAQNLSIPLASMLVFAVVGLKEREKKEQLWKIIQSSFGKKNVMLREAIMKLNEQNCKNVRLEEELSDVKRHIKEEKQVDKELLPRIQEELMTSNAIAKDQPVNGLFERSDMLLCLFRR